MSMTENERLTFETELGISIDKNEDCPTMSICWNCDIPPRKCNYFKDAIDKLAKYESIGTIEEFKALKEKNEPKKILYRKQSYGTPWLCPYCEADQVKVEFFCEDGSEPKEKYTFCWQCGTRIDWSE